MYDVFTVQIFWSTKNQDNLKVADSVATAELCNEISFWKYPRQGCPASYPSQVLAGFSPRGHTTHMNTEEESMSVSYEAGVQIIHCKNYSLNNTFYF